jgi:hypothetical protein
MTVRLNHTIVRSQEVRRRVAHRRWLIESRLPRTIVTTDSEADDMNSFMRLLYYTNELDIAGLIYGSSVHHWQGDDEHTLKQAKELGLITSFEGETAGSPARSDDAKTWRWEPIGWMEQKVTEDYNQIYPNLVKHDPNPHRWLRRLGGHRSRPAGFRHVAAPPWPAPTA